MKIKVLCTFLLCLSVSPVHAAETLLFRLAAHPAPDGSGNVPGMVFQEVERSDSASTVELLHPEGSAAAKSMFLLRGACALMKEREKQAFTVAPLSRQPVRFVLRFADAGLADQPAPERPLSGERVFSAAKCDAMQSIFGK